MARALLTTLLALGVIASAVAVVYTRHESRRVFVELQELQSRRDALNVDWGRLQLEQATWAEASRVEQVARSELGLVAKEPSQVMVIVK